MQGPQLGGKGPLMNYSAPKRPLARGAREIVPVMLVDDDAYTLAEWETNADAPAGWKRSDVGWRWCGRHAPDGYNAAKVSRLGRGSDPKGPRPADARLNHRMLSEQKHSRRSSA